MSTCKRSSRQRALPVALLLALSCARAEPAGTGGVAFWATEVNDSWFNPFRWGGILPWQGGVPNQTASCRIELRVSVEILGQGQFAECLHLEFNEPQSGVRIVGSSHPAQLTVYGTQIDNMATISVGANDALHSSTLAIANNTNANGSGHIRLTSNQFTAQISSTFNTGWLLVNWPSHSILGHGEINVRLQNDGTIEADQNGRTLRFGGSHQVDNNGMVRARNGAGLHLAMANGNFGFLQSSGGQILIENNSSLALTGAGNLGLRGGRVETQGSGLVTVFSQGFPMQDVELVSGSRLTFAGLTGLTIGPLGLENHGLIFTGPSGYLSSEFGASATLSGTGRVQLEGGSLANLSTGFGYALVNGTGHEIGGVGTIALALNNQGTLLADRNGQSSGPTELQLQQAAKQNTGAIIARNGGLLRLFQTAIEQQGDGFIQAQADSAVVLQGGVTPALIRGGRLQSSGNGVFTMIGANNQFDDLILDPGSRVLVPCAATLDLIGDIQNQGLITLDNSGCGPNFSVLRGATLIGAVGEIRLQSDSASVNTTLEGSGGTLRVGSGQLVSGSGRIAGSVDIQGTLMTDQPFAPSGPAGQLSVAGTLTLTANSVWMVDLASAGSFDRISGGGTVNLNGVLAINAVGGFIPAPGATFDLITAGQINGNFRRIDFPPEFAGLDAQIDLFPDRVRLTIIPPMFSDGFEP